MSWADNCGNCGSHRADCDCGDFSIVATKDKKKNMGTTNMSNENIDVIKEYTATLDQLIFLRNSFCEYKHNDKIMNLTVKVSLGVEEFDITALGHGKVVDFLISSCNDKITELKKNIANALYP